MGRFWIAAFFLSSGLCVGLAAGWYRWGMAVPAVVDTGQAMVPKQPGDPLPPRAAPAETTGGFQHYETRVIELIGRQRYVEALEVLLLADQAAVSNAEIAQVQSLLEEAVRLRVSQLNSMGRLVEIDGLYEQLTYAMPERAEYFLLLAEHRISMNNPDMALPVLSQIENHHQLGGRARELIRSITAPEPEPLIDSIKLEKVGHQYLVSAMLDDRQPISLLLDTGASVTTIHPSVLRRLGYSLNGRSAHFSTANGVVEAPMVSIGTLAVGKLSIDSLQVGALEVQSSQYRVDGLLGMDFLRRYQFAVDQDEARLNILSRRN